MATCSLVEYTEVGGSRFLEMYGAVTSVRILDTIETSGCNGLEEMWRRIADGHLPG